MVYLNLEIKSIFSCVTLNLTQVLLTILLTSFIDNKINYITKNKIMRRRWIADKWQTKRLPKIVYDYSLTLNHRVFMTFIWRLTILNYYNILSILLNLILNTFIPSKYRNINSMLKVLSIETKVSSTISLTTTQRNNASRG